MTMERKSVIEHFKELAELTGKPLKTEQTKSGDRLIYQGTMVLLPSRGHRMPGIGALAKRLGLSPCDLRYL